MKSKPKPYSRELAAIKRKLYIGDYKAILAITMESDSSISYQNIRDSFNERSVGAKKIVKIIAAANKMIANRECASPVAE